MASKQPRIDSAILPKAADDLSLIRGIGPAFEGRLHKAGLHTYNQLAAFSPAKLAARINGLSANQIARQDWIGQARKLASKNTRPEAHKKETATPPTCQHYENFTIEFLLDEKKEARRTRVVHVQSGDADTWAGWEALQLMDFLARHAGLHISQAEPTLQKTEIRQTSGMSLGPNSETATKILREPDPAPVFPAVIKPADPSAGTTAAVFQTPTAMDQADVLCLRDLKVTLPDSDVSISFLRQGQPFLVHLTINHGQVVTSGHPLLSYMATIIFKQIGGPCEFADEASSTLELSNSTTLRRVGTNLPAGLYRLSAFVKIMPDKVAPGLTAYLKGDLLEVY